MLIPTVQPKWYADLVTDVLEIRNRAGLAIVRGYWEMGRRILEECERNGHEITNLCNAVAQDAKMSGRALLQSCQFATEYPAWKDVPKDLSWHSIANYLLPSGNGKEPHVSHNSGENEWYTPPQYVEAARKVLGQIDLDPASSDIANKIVKAKHYFTLKDDGLTHDWTGRVWMNPPYASKWIGKFSEKLVRHYQKGDVTEAIVLVNNATETEWFKILLSDAAAVCFLNGRVKFISIREQPVSTPLQGQLVLYLGHHLESFAKAFRPLGEIYGHHQG